MDATAKLFYKTDAKLGEGPIWNYLTGELEWVDIEGFTVNILNTSSKTNKSIIAPSRPGTIVPIDETNAIVALQDGAYILDISTELFSLHSPLDSANVETRLNDGKCDPMGRLWVGGMHMPQTEAAGLLWMVDGEGNTTQQLDSITISNGLVWTKDKQTFYYIDTPTGKIQAFDYDNESGNISNGRTAVVIPDQLGFPDGMAIDAEDKLWVGMWNGDAIVRFDPLTGDMIEKVDVPAHNVTACAFGGADLDTLFITTASLDMTPEEQEKYPDAGSIFYHVPGVKGVQSDFFRLAE